MQQISLIHNKSPKKFWCLLTVHLNIILATDQPNAQILVL